MPDDEELKYLKEFSKTFSFVIKFFEEEKKQNPSNADGFERVKNEYKKDKEAICQLIKNDEYRRKAEEKLREENKKKGGDSPSSPQLSDADKQIASLQGKIQVLEDKLKQTPDSDNSDASQQQKREIKRQIQQLENELKEKEKEKNNTQKGNDFP